MTEWCVGFVMPLPTFIGLDVRRIVVSRYYDDSWC